MTLCVLRNNATNKFVTIILPQKREITIIMSIINVTQQYNLLTHQYHYQIYVPRKGEITSNLLRVEIYLLLNVLLTQSNFRIIFI